MAKHYQIRLGSHLDPSWDEWFDGLVIDHLPNGETLLTGPLVDQAALHGVIAKIRDLGLALLAVNSESTDAGHTHADMLQQRTEGSTIP
jgi:hypothetical protein